MDDAVQSVVVWDYVYQLWFLLLTMHLAVDMSQIQKVSFQPLIKSLVWMFDQPFLFNVFFDGRWEISCSVYTVDAVADSSECSRFCIWQGTPSLSFCLFLKCRARYKGKTLFEIIDILIITTLVGLTVLHTICFKFHSLSKLVSPVHRKVFLFVSFFFVSFFKNKHVSFDVSERLFS